MAEFSSMESLTNALQKDIDKKAKLSVGQKAAITQAGADVLEKQLHDEMEQRHHISSRHGADYRHLIDELGSSHKADGIKAGDTVVGFKDKAYIARFLNDGTIKMHGDHFVDDARAEAESKMYAAMLEAYKKVKDG